MVSVQAVNTRQREQKLRQQLYAVLEQRDLLRQQNATMRDVILAEAADSRERADDMSCDAGNFDGGSSARCDHCAELRKAEYLERVALAQDGQQNRARCLACGSPWEHHRATDGRCPGISTGWRQDSVYYFEIDTNMEVHAES